MSTVEDARYRTKVYLASYFTASNVTWDDDTTVGTVITSYDKPVYPLTRVFIDKTVDLIISIYKPVSTPRFGASATPIGYDESIPNELNCIDKTGLTGSKFLWKAERELRRVLEVYPYGSRRSLSDSVDTTRMEGRTKIHGTKIVLNYRRGIT